MKTITLGILLITLAGCGTIWSVGFMGATLSVEIPRQPTSTMGAFVATAPGDKP